MTDKYKYLILKTFLLLKLCVFTMSLKISAKNFCHDERELLVDLVQENKQKLFVVLSSSLTSEEKNIIWVDIAQQLSEAYGTKRTTDNVAKSGQTS